LDIPDLDQGRDLKLVNGRRLRRIRFWQHRGSQSRLGVAGEPFWGKAWRETRRFAFARMQSAVSHRRAEGTAEEA